MGDDKKLPIFEDLTAELRSKGDNISILIADKIDEGKDNFINHCKDILENHN